VLDHKGEERMRKHGSTNAPHPISIKEAGDYSKSKERKDGSSEDYLPTHPNPQ